LCPLLEEFVDACAPWLAVWTGIYASGAVARTDSKIGRAQFTKAMAAGRNEAPPGGVLKSAIDDGRSLVGRIDFAEFGKLKKKKTSDGGCTQDQDCRHQPCGTAAHVSISEPSQVLSVLGLGL